MNSLTFTKLIGLKNGERNIVLNDVNLKIEEGRSIAILGLNGAGKSTLMRIIGGAEAPDSGKVIRTSQSFMADWFFPDVSTGR